MSKPVEWSASEFHSPWNWFKKCHWLATDIRNQATGIRPPMHDLHTYSDSSTNFWSVINLTTLTTIRCMTVSRDETLQQESPRYASSTENCSPAFKEINTNQWKEFKIKTRKQNRESFENVLQNCKNAKTVFGKNGTETAQQINAHLVYSMPTTL